MKYLLTSAEKGVYASYTSTIFSSPGIHGQGSSDESVRLSEYNKALTKGTGVEARSINYEYGTFADVLFSTLNLSNAYAYDFAEQVYNAAGSSARGSLVDLTGQSGGVQRILAGSKYLGELGIGVNSIVGFQGPAFGRFENANQVSLLGNRGDAISWMGRVTSPGVFAPNLQTNFNYKLQPSEPKHITPTPYSGPKGVPQPGFTNEVIDILNRYRP